MAVDVVKSVWAAVVSFLGLQRVSFRRKTLAADAKAALVLGVESVPDGLASGLLAGVNPVAGLYAYMVGATSAALFTSSTFMAVQGTSAMAIVVADVEAVHSGDDPARMLWTLSVLTGVVMLLAGFFRLGRYLRFVSRTVMVGFITALGANIVLGQLDDFTGYASSGGNRVLRALDLVLHLWQVHLPTVVVGVVTVVLIVVLRRTRLAALGMVVAIIVGSVLAHALIALGSEIAVVGDIADIPRGLPMPSVPLLGEVFVLAVPAVSLAFVGLVQGAGIAGALPNPDGSKSDVSQDFVAQGAGNVAAGVLQGLPVGGSMSASSLVVSAGARTRTALVLTGVVIGVVIVLFGGAVQLVAMPALAGLLIVVGVETVKPADVVDVFHTGTVQATVMITTLVLTLLIPLQYAVLVGVGLSIILSVVRQSNELSTKRLVAVDGRFRIADAPKEVPAHEVVILQPFGSLFFASAPTFERQLPTVTDLSTGSVVILRLRGKEDLGATLIGVLTSYTEALHDVGSKLVLVTDSDRIVGQLRATSAAATIGEDNIVRSTTWLTEALSDALSDATAWVDRRRSEADTAGPGGDEDDAGTDRRRHRGSDGELPPPDE